MGLMPYSKRYLLYERLEMWGYLNRNAFSMWIDSLLPNRPAFFDRKDEDFFFFGTSSEDA
jgi:hypothetical protein